MNSNIKLSWIGGHIDILGNDLADKAAKEGAMRSDLPSSDTMTLKAVKQMILEATLEKWQKAWDLSNTGKHMKEIETTVSTTVKHSLPPSRLMQKTFHQLRIGRGPLNDQDPIDKKSVEEKRCDSCGAIEDTSHFILNCPRYTPQRRNMWNNILSHAEESGIDSRTIPMDITILSHNLDLPAKMRTKIALEISQYISATKRLQSR